MRQDAALEAPTHGRDVEIHSEDGIHMRYRCKLLEFDTIRGNKTVARSCDAFVVPPGMTERERATLWHAKDQFALMWDDRYQDGIQRNLRAFEQSDLGADLPITRTAMCGIVFVEILNALPQGHGCLANECKKEYMEYIVDHLPACHFPRRDAFFHRRGVPQ